MSSSRFDENSDISMTYLGRIGQEKSQNKLKAASHFLYQEMAIPWVDCWMVQNVNYCWTQALVNLLCQNQSIYAVSHYTPY